MNYIAISYVQHSQAVLEHGVCELGHSFFHIVWYSCLITFSFIFIQGTSWRASYTQFYICGLSTTVFHFIRNLISILLLQRFSLIMEAR